MENTRFEQEGGEDNNKKKAYRTPIYIRRSAKNYYDRHRERILEKKRAVYQKQKEEQIQSEKGSKEKNLL